MSKAARPKDALSKIRNIGIIAHIDAGKTTLTERILYYSGRIHRMGEVHEGTATMDFMPEEQERGITIGSACTTCEWDGHTINLIDTPGHVDFTIEVERSLRVLDGAVGVFCAVGGVEPQSETVWRQSEKYDVPKIVFINKMDRIGADFEAVLESMKERLRITPLVLQVPVGAGDEFEGVIDVIGMRFLVFDAASRGEDFEARALSPEQEELASQWREALFDVLSEQSDEILELYMNGEDIPRELLDVTIRKATLERTLVPVLAGSALKNTGIQPVLDAVCAYLPGPQDVPGQKGRNVHGVKIETVCDPKEPLEALVFKVSLETGHKLVLLRVYSGTLEAGQMVYNASQKKDERAAHLYTLHADRKTKIEQAVAGEIVAVAGLKFAKTGDTLSAKDAPVQLENIESYRPVISLALEPRNTEERNKLEEVLESLLLEDPTLAAKIDEETEQLVLSGMGELHLDVVLDRIRREFKIDPRVGNPQVVYQESVTKTAQGEATFDRELGDTEHYGAVTLTVEPLERGAGQHIRLGFEPVGWPEAWIDAATEGIEDALQSGVVRGYPVRDVRIRIDELGRMDGKSSTVGYHMAAAEALKLALTNASPCLLEPIMKVEVSVPDEFVGEVISLLGAKGAKIENMFDKHGQKLVQAFAALRQLFGFSTELRSATQGRAGMLMQFDRFDVLG
ncbi:elongation factor G [Desulfobaculum bizertense]|uniref:Elongation factor G n=1 Tax=Desulfobaculum bizertense DSM 18034 TaxID=1121442 RepID=A0A1T4W1N4_9BACT|nr:elongation factor G [Desulfobaculum bizertense]SKA71049.1 elongation factor G [Desulfobaculum bizertense DSM 18034]